MAIECFTTGGERKNRGNKNKENREKREAQAWSAERIALRRDVLFPLDWLSIYSC